MAGRTKREEVYLKAGERCAVCGRPLALNEMTIDHTKAQSSFGKGEVRNDIGNLACFCGRRATFGYSLRGTLCCADRNGCGGKERPVYIGCVP